MVRRTIPVSERPFTLKRIRHDLAKPCKLWSGILTERSNGYVQVKHQGKMEYLHRLAYCADKQVSIDSIAGILICHHCDVRHCFEGTHLFPGTYADNNRDKAAKGRAYTGDQKGENNPKAKFTDKQIREIRASLAKGTSGVALALKHGCSKAAISAIGLRQRWSHIK